MPNKKSVKRSVLPDVTSANGFVTAMIISYLSSAALGLVLTSNLNYFVLLFYFVYFWYGYAAVLGILYVGSLLIVKKIKDRLLFLIVSMLFICALAMIPVPPGLLSLVGPIFVVILRVLQLKN